MLFVAALLPVVIYIIVIYNIDHFALVSVKRLLMLVGTGMMTALVCFGLFRLTDGLFSSHLSDIVHPVTEEIMKAIPLLILACRKKIVFFIDSVICGAAVGGGFSILENLFYLMLGRDMGMGTALFRGLEVALIHMGCSAVVAAAFMLAVREVERLRSQLEIMRSDVVKTVFLLMAALVLHVLHNMFHFNPLLQFACVIAAMGALLACTYFYDVDMIHRWLDRGLDKQISLLQTIEEGHLDETPTGIFLESIKESFPPYDYYDIICYVRLHLELSMTAKTRFMLREVGIDMPMEKEKRELVIAQFIEIEQVEKRIGKSAKITIAPIIKSDPADIKALNSLRDECKAEGMRSISFHHQQFTLQTF